LSSALLSYAAYSHAKNFNYLDRFNKLGSNIFADAKQRVADHFSAFQVEGVKSQLTALHRRKLYDLNNSSNPLIYAEIAGVDYMSVLDTGADFSLINLELANKLREVNYFPKETDKLFVTANGVTTASGVMHIPVRLQKQDKYVTHRFYIIDDLPMILLGRDFMNHFHITFSVLNDDPYWMFKGVKRPFLDPKKKVKKVLNVNRTNIQKLNLDLIKEGKLVKMDNCPEEAKQHLNKILRKHASAFNTNPGQTDRYEFTIELKPGAVLPKQMPFPANPMKRQIIDRIMDEQIAHDWIEPSHSSCSSPCFLVPKPGNDHRMVQAYQKVNDGTKQDCYPQPTLKEIFASLEGAKYYTVFDMAKGFYQIKIRESDRWATAFVNHRGLWQYKVLPFGLKNAPAAFQRLMDMVLGENRRDYCLCYIDDVIIFSKTLEEHLAHIDLVVQKLKAAGLTINPKKTQLCLQQIKYLGMIVTPEGYSPDPEKVAAIQDFPEPANKKKLLSFLGSCNFYHNFLPRVSDIAAPLHNLLKQKTVWKFDDACKAAFKAIKQLILDHNKLYFPDMNLPFTIRTDASDVGLGAVLLQGLPDKPEVLIPIVYASRSLSQTEKNYSTTHKELLAIRWALKKFKGYIEYTSFFVETDHKALKWLMNLKDPCGKLARWAVELMEFDLDIEHIPGKDNDLADMLSRDPVGVPECEDMDNPDCKLTANQIADLKWRAKQENRVYVENKAGIMFTNYLTTEDNIIGPYPELELHAVKYAQRSDKFLSKVIDFLVTGKMSSKDPNLQARIRTLAEDCCIFDNDLLVKYVPNWRVEDDSFDANFKIVAPDSLQHLLMRIYHDHPLSGHQGVNRTVKLLAQKWTWYKMIKMVREHCKTCVDCQKCKATNRKPAGLLQPNRASYPFEVLAIDFVGPLPTTQKGNSYLLVLVDTFTKWVEVFPMKSDKGEFVVEKLMETCCRFGFPRILISDNGSNFASDEFAAVCDAFNIAQKFCPTYWPQANPTERQNRNIKDYLRRYCKVHRQWDINLPLMAYNLRTNCVGTTTYTAAEMLMGRNLNDPFAVKIQNITPPINEDYRKYRDKVKLKLESIYSDAKENLQISREQNRKGYDHFRRYAKYEVGDLVLVKIHPLSCAATGEASSMFRRQEGPFRIAGAMGENVYRLAVVDTGATYGVAHVSQLESYHIREGVTHVEVPNRTSRNRAARMGNTARTAS